MGDSKTIGRVYAQNLNPKDSIDIETTLELDSHADTCVVGEHALIIYDFHRPTDVHGYDKTQGSQRYRTVTAVLKYIHPFTGVAYHLVIHQAIHIPHLPHHLLCPMQCRVNDVVINDLPKFLDPHPSDTSHAILCPVHSLDDDEPVQMVTLPLRLQGVTSYLNVGVPTADEWTSAEYPRLVLTSEHLTWDPHDPSYGQQEDGMTDIMGNLRQHGGDRSLLIQAVQVCDSNGSLDVLDDDVLGDALDAQIAVVHHDDVAPLTNGTIRTRTHKPIDYMTLAQRWCIAPDRAKRTIDTTTQRGVRTCLYPNLSRRFDTNDRMLRYTRLRPVIFTDTMFANIKSRRNNKCAQVFATNFGWVFVVPMTTKGDAHDALSLCLQRYGAPVAMVVDGSKEQIGKAFRRKLQQADCQLRQTEPYSPWQQAAEGAIREVKRASARLMVKSQAPKVLWDHSLELAALIRSHTASDILSAAGEVPLTILTGSTADISAICQFGWYDWVMFRDVTPTFPDESIVLGRYLGPALDVGSALTAKILKSNGQVVYRSTLRLLTPDELADPAQIALRTSFDQTILQVLGPSATWSDFPAEDHTPDPDADTDDASLLGDGLDGFNFFDDTPPQEPTPEIGDNYVAAELLLPRGGEMARGRVVSRKRDRDNNPVGRAHSNPILDTREYNVLFDDGQQMELTANLIAESMYSQCDLEGNQYLLLDTFIDYRKTDKALTIEQQTSTDASGRVRRKKTCAGWQLCCQWRDGSTSWQDLALLRNSHPIEVAEYAVAQRIDEEPAFNWWVPYVLKKRKAIIKAVKSRKTGILRKTHKFGIEIPTSVEHALRLDAENGNTLWADAIAAEMKEVKVAVRILSEDEPDPVGYQKIRCHMIFDVKMEDFRRKARLVAGGHVTKAPASITYASVVSRETVRLALMIAALNDLEVKAGDVLNAYLTATNTEKIWTVLGPEWGPDRGKRAILVRALYGLKSAGASFRSHLGACMRELGYESCKADPDLWYKAMVRPSDGAHYYAYILCYVDDILCIHHDAMSVLSKINDYMKLKPSSIGDPDIYLGTKLRRVQLTNGVWAWSMSPSKYVQQAVANCRAHLKSNYAGRYTLRKRADNPFPTGYEPGMDTTALLTPDAATYYQSVIGVMRWMVEIGRVDIATEVSLLSSYLAAPREGHMDAALHIMSYLGNHHNTRLIFDPTYPTIDYASFPQCEWKEFYPDAEEPIPLDAPEARGRPVDVRMFVDSDHASDKSIRRSRTGVLIFCNNALIDWISKRQPTVETSVFGAEFVAMKYGMEKLRALRYKLRMMGVRVDAPSYIYGDNQAVVTNTQRPESQLGKKNNSICYHFARESVAMGESLVTHIETASNYADLMTKVLYGGRRRFLVSGLLNDIYDEHTVARPT